MLLFNRGIRHRARLAFSLGLVAAAVTFGIAWAGSSGTGDSPAQKPSPKALTSLLDDLGILNAEIDVAVGVARDGDVKKAQEGLVDFFKSGGFAQIVVGIGKLGPECLASYRLGLTRERLIDAIASAHLGGEVFASALEEAQKEKEKAEKALKKAGAAERLLDDLGVLNAEIDVAVGVARDGDVKKAQEGLVDFFKSGGFAQIVVGIGKLGPECLASYRLGLTRERLIDAIASAHLGGEVFASALEEAQKEKEKAEKALKTQLEHARCTETGTNGNDVLKGNNGTNVLCGKGGKDVLEGKGGPDVLIGGKGKDVLVGGEGNDICVAGPGDVKVKCGDGAPSCEAGTYTSPVKSITVQADESKLLWFPTPIPNFFYYEHQGFDSGGCDNVNDKLVVNIAVNGWDGVVAYRYDEPPAGSDKIENGRDCPVASPTGEINETCIVFAPQLGFNARNAEDVKTYSVGVSVQNGRGDGVSATASLSVVVTWRPK